jgi:hypothetical protein
MGRHLFTVGDRLQLRGRGGVLVIPWHGESIRIGDQIEVRSMDGQIKNACITGFGHCPPSLDGLPLLLSANVSIEDVPLGTEVWSA